MQGGAYDYMEGNLVTGAGCSGKRGSEESTCATGRPSDLPRLPCNSTGLSLTLPNSHRSPCVPHSTLGSLEREGSCWCVQTSHTPVDMVRTLVTSSRLSFKLLNCYVIISPAKSSDLPLPDTQEASSRKSPTLRLQPGCLIPNLTLLVRLSVILASLPVPRFLHAGWRDPSVVTSAYCSYRGSEFTSQCSHQMVHRHLELQHQVYNTLYWPSRIPALTWHAHINKETNNKSVSK